MINKPNKTLAIIKPDAMSKGYKSDIIRMILRDEFTIISLNTVRLTHAQACVFYKEHNSKVWFSELINFMISGEVTILVLEKENAALAWRESMNPIRLGFGESIDRNAVHGSDSDLSARREINLFQYFKILPQ